MNSSNKALSLLLGSGAIVFSLVACAGQSEDATSADLAATATPCGNGVRDTGEQCDDGNTANLDGCSSTCQFEQVHRMNSISMLFSTDNFCTANAIGGAIKSVAQSQISTAINNAVGDGSLSVLLQAAGLADATGENGSFTLESYVGAPVSTSSLGLDAAFTASKTSLNPDLTPKVSMPATSTSGAVAAGPGDLAFSLALAGAPVNINLSNARTKATVGASSAPGGHAASQHLDPSLETFATTSGGQMCGNISAASLAGVPVPAQLTSGSTSCSQGYDSSNSMLDVIVGGCTVFIVTALGATQPDQATSAPAVGAGAPYKLTKSGTHVTGCKDKSGASVDLNACLAAAGYSAGFKFTTQRVQVDGTSE